MKKIAVLLVLFVSFFSNSFSDELYVSKIIADENGRILEGYNPDEVHPLASITKMMTVLVAIDKVEKGFVNYEDLVSISRTAAYMRGSYINFHIGEKQTLEDLLKAVIVYSGNDAAYAIAEYISGTEDKFVEEMNKKAQELNMTSTKFYTSTGLPPNMTKKPEDNVDVSTAHDITLLSAELLKHSKYLKYSKEPFITLPRRDQKFQNRNNLLGVFEGVDGLKTGHHSLANYNIAISCLKNDMRLIIVVFGAPNEKLRDEEVLRTLNYSYTNYTRVKIGSKGDFALEVPIQEAPEKKIKLFLENDLFVTLHKDWKFDKIASVPPIINAPLTAGEKVGTLSIKANSQIVTESNLIVLTPVEKISWFRKALRVITFNLL